METIIFDVDDTLYDQSLSFKNTYKRMIDVELDDDELYRLFIVSRKYSDSLFDKCEAGELTVQEMHIQRIKLALKEFNILISDAKALEFQEAYVEEQGKIVLFPEIVELLDYLVKQGKQLGILTNGMEKHQGMKINQLGLEKWIPKEHHFISGALGIAKPNIEPFQIIEERLGLNRSKTVYVGDSFANDIVGAKNAGWKAVWMNHRKRALPEGKFKPDYEVHSAKELLDLFK